MIGTTRSRRARLLVAGGAALLCALGAALGTWQIVRLQWKLDLIERVEQRVHAAPVAAPGPDRWAGLDRQRDEYRHLRLDGRFLDERATRVQALTALGAGHWLLTPFRRDDGTLVLVNRGFLPAGTLAVAPGGAASLTGLLRMSEPDGAFLRDNDAKAERWYSRDVGAIAAARGLSRVAPYFIDQDGAPPASGLGQGAPNRPRVPVGGLTVISFNNHHLVYALTWFVMSLMAAAAGWFVLREDGAAKGLPPSR
jgi:surfeit locus 1 family protein